jgi:hypothetical protein
MATQDSGRPAGLRPWRFSLRRIWGRSRTDMMMALRAHARGGPEQLVYEDAPVPVPAPGEALVAVHAAGITFAELTWDLTWTTRDGRDRTPVIPAHEMSGTVTGLGGAAGVAPGDEVYGLIGFDRDGAAAEYVTMPAAELAARPRSVPHVAAATLPLAALTAWQALVNYAALEAGERVLVHGGAGGVGVYAVQLAAVLGGQVTATGSARDAEFVRPRRRGVRGRGGGPVRGADQRRGRGHRHGRRRDDGAVLRRHAARRPAGDAGRPACRGPGPRARGARHVLRGHAGSR